MVKGISHVNEAVVNLSFSTENIFQPRLEKKYHRGSSLSFNFAFHSQVSCRKVNAFKFVKSKIDK